MARNPNRSYTTEETLALAAADVFAAALKQLCRDVGADEDSVRVLYGHELAERDPSSDAVALVVSTDACFTPDLSVVEMDGYAVRLHHARLAAPSWRAEPYSPSEMYFYADGAR